RTPQRGCGEVVAGAEFLAHAVDAEEAAAVAFDELGFDHFVTRGTEGARHGRVDLRRIGDLPGHRVCTARRAAASGRGGGRRPVDGAAGADGVATEGFALVRVLRVRGAGVGAAVLAVLEALD